MKHFIPALILVLLVVGCSKKIKNDSVEQPSATATDLGKDINYFSNLYGPAKSQKQANEYDFPLPSVGHLIKLTKPFEIQQFVSGKLNITAVFSEGSTRAIWVKYHLPNPWTQDQIKAALAAYDKKWTATNQSMSLNLLMPGSAPVTYESSSKIFASKTMFNELIIYSPTILQELHKKIADEEQQKQAVPKF